MPRHNYELCGMCSSLLPNSRCSHCPLINEAGLHHDEGKPPFDLLSTKALIGTAKVMEFGKRKYDAHNWRKGIAWSKIIASALRHLNVWKDGEDLDPESGLSHLDHAACCIMFLQEYLTTCPHLDDRWKGATK